MGMGIGMGVGVGVGVGVDGEIEFGACDPIKVILRMHLKE